MEVLGKSNVLDGDAFWRHRDPRIKPPLPGIDTGHRWLAPLRRCCPNTNANAGACQRAPLSRWANASA